MQNDFTKEMRRETKKIHNISDALINAKLGIALSDERVWTEGLLVFYEVFKYLEEALIRLSDSHIYLNEIDIIGMRRTANFEKDLNYYLGKNWKENYTIRPSVKEYLSYLKKLEEKDATLLLAFIYHLYMGLFSGGQILKKKKELFLKLSFSNNDKMEGLAVVEFKDKNVYTMKKEMKEVMNEIATRLDEEMRQQLIEESKMVFVLNNKLVHSIQGTNNVIISKTVKYAVIVVIFACLFIYIYKGFIK